MTVWVDADSCARPAREVLEKASLRCAFPLIYVSNRPIPLLIEGALVDVQVVSDADACILEQSRAGDLCITRDIPLSCRLLAVGVSVMSDKGEMGTLKDMEKKARVGEWNKALLQAGVGRDKRATYSLQDKHSFAISLDRWLARKN
jgi:uncharacterized protein YaiI (UPF0178 family)